MTYYTIEREDIKTGDKIILDKEQTEELAISLNGNIRVVEAMVAGIPLARGDYRYSIVGGGGRMVTGKPQREDIWWGGILNNLKEQGILGEYMAEGKDRIVYSHALNPNLVIKIPKNTDAEEINEIEYQHYLTEDNLAKRLGKNYCTDGLARCVYDRKNRVLYMEKLKVTEGSNFGVNANGIIRRFDLNPII